MEKQMRLETDGPPCDEGGLYPRPLRMEAGDRETVEGNAGCGPSGAGRPAWGAPAPEGSGRPGLYRITSWQLRNWPKNSCMESESAESFSL